MTHFTWTLGTTVLHWPLLDSGIAMDSGVTHYWHTSLVPQYDGTLAYPNG